MNVGDVERRRREVGQNLSHRPSFFSGRFRSRNEIIDSTAFFSTAMPPSQLKQLKASLRDNGVIRPQQSKKQKRQDAKTGASAQNRNQRNAALQAIRDRFNPFEIKAPSNRSKFEATTRDGNSKAAGQSRPGVTKSLGEERVRRHGLIFKTGPYPELT